MVYYMIKNVDVTPNRSKKLIPMFKGPYVIKKILDNDRIIVADVPGFPLTQIPYEGIVPTFNVRPWPDAVVTVDGQLSGRPMMKRF